MKKAPGSVPFSWSERRGSNPRPRPWQGRALPAELLSRLSIYLCRRIVDANLKGFIRLSSLLRIFFKFINSTTNLKTDYKAVRLQKKFS